MSYHNMLFDNGLRTADDSSSKNIIFMKTKIVKFENLKPHLWAMAQSLKCSLTKSYRYLYSTVQDT